MKITAISDTHSQNLITKWEFKPTDILIHAGDLTARGQLEAFREQTKKLSQLPAWVILYVPGNHDRLAASDPDMVRDVLGPRIKMLIDEEVSINGVKFFGQPWLNTQPIIGIPGDNFQGAFRVAQISLKRYLIPSDTDVLVTHDPPYGIRDTSLAGGAAHKIGCTSLYSQVAYRVHPKFHIFGHNHRGYGVSEIGETTFVNASLVDEEYRVSNQPIEFEV